MKSTIIKSESSLRRYPLPAFAMSFLFTGLGQIYNGDFSKGIVLFILRIISLIFIPLYVIIQNSFSIIPALTAALFHIGIWIFSSVEAMHSAKDKRSFNLKKYNSILLYIFYIIINSAFVAFSIFLIISLFSVQKIDTDDMNPALLKNDYILINKYAAKKIAPGDVILLSLNNKLIAGRIIASDADMVSKKGNNYYINDAALSYTVISKPELEKLGLPNSEDIFFEINGEKKYPVLIKSGNKNNEKIAEPINLGKGEFLIAFDNRIKNGSWETVAQDSVIGRVEGILYRKDIKSIFSRTLDFSD